MMKKLSLALLFAPSLLIATAAQAQVVRVSAANFNAAAGVITFSEKALGTTNPVYLPAQYGGTPTAPTVSFGGFFVGQSLSANASADCPGGAATACVVGNATGPLTLAANSPNTFIVNDGADPTSPVLSGSPTFNGPISAISSARIRSQSALYGGFFDAIRSTGIVAYARDGSVLGTISNLGRGIEFLGLGVADGTARIAGVGLRLTGAEPAGFGIDNLRFGTAGQVNIPAVPEPASWAMMICGFGVMGSALRYRRREASVSFA